MQWNNLWVRSRTALFFVGGCLFALYFNAWTYAILIALILVVGHIELEKIFILQRTKNAISIIYLPFTLVFGVFAFMSTLLIAQGFLNYQLMLWGIPFLLLPFVFELWSGADQPIRNIAFQHLAFFYITLPLCLLNFIAFDENGVYQPLLVIGMILIIWVNDAGAYLVGSLIGKRKLFERISPKKTVEGSLGGVVSSLVVATLVHFVFGVLTLKDWLILGLILSIFASFGDLIQSLFKRSVKIKDTGALFPGHGGVLDRFDAFFFSIPFALLYYILFL